MVTLSCPSPQEEDVPSLHLEMEESEKVLAEDVIQEMIGVSKLVRYISQSGKPLVGHNCLLGRK